MNRLRESAGPAFKLGSFMVGAALLLSGCLHLSRTAPFQYEPAAIPCGEPVPRSAGFHVLIDDRPRGDRARTRGINNLPERVTAKLAEDFRKQKIFRAVYFPADDQEDVIIAGAIKRFSWGAYENPLGLIPLVSLVRITGIPLGVAGGVVEIRLELKDGKTGENLGAVSAWARTRHVFNLYDLAPDWPGTELGESFRAAEAQLGERVASKFPKALPKKEDSKP